MADPTGLVSLGLGVVKKAVKHGSTVRSRQRHLKALSSAIDISADILHDAEQSGDPATRDAHREVLDPCIFEAKEFLRRVENRKLLASTIKKVWSASDDDEELKRLLAALNGAPERIDARVQVLRISSTHTQENHEILTRLGEQQSEIKSVKSEIKSVKSDVDSLRSDLARYARIFILCMSFFR